MRKTLSSIFSVIVFGICATALAGELQNKRPWLKLHRDHRGAHGQTADVTRQGPSSKRLVPRINLLHSHSRTGRFRRLYGENPLKVRLKAVLKAIRRHSKRGVRLFTDFGRTLEMNPHGYPLPIEAGVSAHELMPPDIVKPVVLSAQSITPVYDGEMTEAVRLAEPRIVLPTKPLFPVEDGGPGSILDEPGPFWRLHQLFNGRLGWKKKALSWWIREESLSKGCAEIYITATPPKGAFSRETAGKFTLRVSETRYINGTHISEILGIKKTIQEIDLCSYALTFPELLKYMQEVMLWKPGQYDKKPGQYTKITDHDNLRAVKSDYRSWHETKTFPINAHMIRIVNAGATIIPATDLAYLMTSFEMPLHPRLFKTMRDLAANNEFGQHPMQYLLSHMREAR